MFVRNQYNVTLNVNDAAMGSVEGTGTYAYGDNAVIKAIPADDCHSFVRWSDGETDAMKLNERFTNVDYYGHQMDYKVTSKRVSFMQQQINVELPVMFAIRAKGLYVNIGAKFVYTFDIEHNK